MVFGFGKIIQPVAYPKTKGRLQWKSGTRMTKRASVQLLLPGQPSGIDNVYSRGLTRMFGMEVDMPLARPMTFLAVDPINKLAFVKKVPIFPVAAEDGPRIGCMTLQTAGRHLPVEEGRIRGIPGTVAPVMRRCKIAYGQLEQPLALPIKKTLALPPRADDHPKRFAAEFPPILVSRFIKAAVL